MRKLSFIIILALMLCLSMQAFAVSLENGQSLSGGVCQANGDDESAVEVSGTAQAELIGVTVQKTGGKASSTDSASFCGLNAAVRVYDSAVLMISGCQIEASASNATGVFAYDRGTIYIENSSVNVTGGGAGGVQVAGGGTLIGQNLTVTSASKAAIRSDRGGGTMELAGGTYISTGSNGCPRHIQYSGYYGKERELHIRGFPRGNH